MEYKAEAKNIKISPRKVRLVADSVRNLQLDQALASLSVLNKRASDPIRKVLESAVANAVNNFQASRGDLSIKEIMVGEGIMYKRYHYAARGRVRPYLKRTSHIRVILEDQIDRVSKMTQAAEKAVVEMTEPVKKKETKKIVKTEKKGEKKTK